MPRPTRMEYEGAFFHVMNRCRSHQNIFHENVYFEAFELSHPGSVSFSIDIVGKEVSERHWKTEIGRMDKQLVIIKSA